jgi:hypothetical protein
MLRIQIKRTSDKGRHIYRRPGAVKSSKAFQYMRESTAQPLGIPSRPSNISRGCAVLSISHISHRRQRAATDAIDQCLYVRAGRGACKGEQQAARSSVRMAAGCEMDLTDHCGCGRFTAHQCFMYPVSRQHGLLWTAPTQTMYAPPNSVAGAKLLFEEEHINASYTDGQQSQDHTK